MMYLKVKDLAGGRYESLYELAYVFYGRSAIFFVCVVQYVLNFASIVLYFIILGEVFEKMTATIILSGKEEAPTTNKERK